MPDVQIVSSKVAARHSDYTLPEAASFVLKAVYAEFTDNGAVADWIPTVIIVSDSNHTVAEASDQGVKVTAGDDAEVSWFPGVKHAASSSAAGGGAPNIILLKGVHKNLAAVVGGASGQAPFDAATYQVFGTAIWTFTLDGSGNIVEVKASTPGRYESVCNFDFDAPGGANQETMTADVFGTIPLAVQVSGAASISTAAVFEGMVMAVTSFTTGTAQFSCGYDLGAAVTGGIVVPYWWIKHWPV